METILKTHNLTKKFKDKIAVNNINITINKGDIYGFIGKNGAGKTTTMKLILGLIFPDFGAINLFNDTNLNVGRKKIGSLIEAPGLYKNCSAYENMKRFAILNNANEKDIKSCLKLVGLDTNTKKVNDFSLGMKQRLGIAIALLGNPELLILDEPINGLDPEGIKDIRDIILKLNKEHGITFLISSHLLDELAKIVTRYGIINNGVLVEEITTKDLEVKTESYLKITTNNNLLAINLIKKYFKISYIDIKENSLILKSNLDLASSINKMLNQNNILVDEISIKHQSFEEYFIERII